MTRLARPAAGLASLMAAALVAAACRPASEERVPPAQLELPAPTTGTAQPVSVTGCLRAGDAADTYVLMTTAEEETETATYQLVGAAGIDLQEHAGHTVEVAGTRITPEEGTQIVDTPVRDAPSDPEHERPAVRTRTEVEIHELNVAEIRRVRDGC